MKLIKNNKTGKVHLLSYIKSYGWQSRLNTTCLTMAGVYVSGRFTLLKDHPVTCLKCRAIMDQRGKKKCTKDLNKNYIKALAEIERLKKIINDIVDQIPLNILDRPL